MRVIENESFDSERALYESDGVMLKNCSFQGEADGESALKESKNIKAEGCLFDLRYPFWHDENVEIVDCEMTNGCRAGLWYSKNIIILNSKLHGIKALRECENATIEGCHIVSGEFGWNNKGVRLLDSFVSGEYFMLGTRELYLENVEMEGKYSFQYTENAVIENCRLNTKDAFWHAKNITVKNSYIKGEYLGWYSENVTFEDCVITGTQPLCYCKGLKLVNCQMHECDLAFEKSEVEAEITTPITSIKNVLSGKITVPRVDEIIKDHSFYLGKIEVTENI